MKHHRRRRVRRSPASRPRLLERINPHAAGIDCGSAEHYRRGAARSRRHAGAHRFRPSPAISTGSPTGSRPAGDARGDGSHRACTGFPIYEILEARGFEVILVNARHVKNRPGPQERCLRLRVAPRPPHRGTLLRGSFRPADGIVALRGYLRHRRR